MPACLLSAAIQLNGFKSVKYMKNLVAPRCDDTD